MKRTFVDSNVLIRAFCGDNEASEQALAILDDPDRELVSSDVVELEVTGKPHYFQKVEAQKFYAAFFDSVTEVDRTTPEAMATALELARTFGLGGMDALVASAAIRLGAHEFITTEKPTKAFFRIVSQTTKFVSLHGT